MVRRLVRFQIQVEHDQWPFGRIPLQQRLVDVLTNVVEEVLVHARLVAGRFRAVRNHLLADLRAWIHVPNQILLDGKGKAAG